MMKSAIIETGGKQYRVSPGKTFTIEKIIGKKAGESVVFDKVLLFDDGKEVKVGMPYLDGVSVEAVVEKEGKGKKVLIVQYKSKTRMRRKRGHRQPFMKTKISA